MTTSTPGSEGPIAGIIAALIGNYMTTLFVVGLLVAAVRILRLRGDRSPAAVSGLLLDAYVFWAIGCAQVVNFVMHSVFGDFAARTIGWAQSPFQMELALSSLGVGVMGFILHSARSPFRGKVALVVATAVFGWGAALGHVYQLVVNDDHAVNNTGLLLVMDVVIPAVGLALVVWHAAALRRAARAGHATARTDALVGGR